MRKDEKKMEVTEVREVKEVREGERTLDSLRAAYPGKIYIWFEDDEIYGKFLKDAEAQGYLMGIVEPSKCDWPRDIVSLCFDKKILACNIISHWAFNEGEGIARVDYGRFISGAEDYLIEGEEIVKKGYKVTFL